MKSSGCWYLGRRTAGTTFMAATLIALFYPLLRYAIALNRAIVEYALRESKKPIGVASYQIVKRLPKALAGELPEPKEIEKLLMDLNDERKKSR